MGLGMHKMVRLGFFLLAFLVSNSAEANGVPPAPLRNQLTRADLVVVGQLGPATFCVVGNRRYPCAEMAADVVLKGSLPSPGVRTYVILNFGVMELSIEHVRVPTRALFFLKRMQFEGPDEAQRAVEYYRPVSGHQSVLPINESPVR